MENPDMPIGTSSDELVAKLEILAEKVESFGLGIAAPLKEARRSIAMSPVSVLNSTRTAAELLTKEITRSWGTNTDELSQWDRLREVAANGMVPPRCLDALHKIRKAGNVAIHEGDGSATESEERLADLILVAEWWLAKIQASSQDEGDTEVTVPPERAMVRVDHGALETTRRGSPGVDDAWPQAALDVLGLLWEVRSIAQTVSLPLTDFDKAAQTYRDGLENALSPFCLGVVGAFRSGKSTLVNALLGEELALTDVTETTAILGAYGAGERREVLWKYVNGGTEITSIEEANHRLDRRRGDVAWLETIDHLHFRSPAVLSDNMVLWDGPGLGGNEINEKEANRLLSRISGAMWLLDVELLGDASIVQPLERLRKAGIPVIGILNRIDALDPDQVGEAIDFVQTTYPGAFLKVVPISALNGLKAVLEGRVDDGLEKLRGVVQESLVLAAPDAREQRIACAVKEGALEAARAVRKVRRLAAEDLGLLDHVEDGARRNIQRVLEEIPEWIAAAAGDLWRAEEANILANLKKQKSSGVADSIKKLARRKASMSKLVSAADQHSPLDEGWDRANRQVLDTVLAEWAELTREEVRLLRDAMPQMEQGESPFHQTPEQRMINPDGEAIKDAGIVAASSAAALGLLAVASAAVAWPVVFLAVPPGLVAGYLRRRSLKDQLLQEMPELEMHTSERVKLIFAQKRKYIRTHLEKSLPTQVEQHLEKHMVGEVKSLEQQVFSTVSRADVEGAVKQLDLRLALLYKHGGQAEHPGDQGEVVLPEGSSAGTALREILAGEDDRLDLSIGRYHSSLAQILPDLTANVRVRLLTSVSQEEEPELRADLERAFETYQARLMIRNLRDEAGQSVTLEHELVVTSSAAWVSGRPLREIGRREMVLKAHPLGYRAAEREFASRWNAIIPGRRRCVAVPIR